MKRLILRWLPRVAVIAVLASLMLPALALAAGTALVPVPQIWVLLLGALTPLVTYVLNHFAPWVGEAVKATVLAVVAGVVGAIYTAIETSTFGWNNTTLQLILTAILGAFGAHLLLWKPSSISTKLGGGTDTTPKARAHK